MSIIIDQERGGIIYRYASNVGTHVAIGRKPWATLSGQVRYNLANRQKHLHQNDARVGLVACRCGTCHCCRMAIFLRRFFTRFGRLPAIALLLLVTSLQAAPRPVEVVAAVLVAEAGGEGVMAMQAVREVIQMRAWEQRRSELTIVTARKQFSCLNRMSPARLVEHAKKSSTWNKALALASRPVDRATVWQANHYHHHSVRPAWARGARPLAYVGGHYFYRL